MDQVIVGNDWLGCYRAVMDEDRNVHFLNGHGRVMFVFNGEEGFEFVDGFTGPKKELMEYITQQFNKD